ncbi:MAG: hypothetical protein KJ592_03875, partial [Nanoarchaeota archaeon]|nr:hypothetical protein [Nanoarchaeota archaeon]
VNYNGEFTDDGYNWIEDGKAKEFSPNSVNIIAGGFLGMVVAKLIRPSIISFKGYDLTTPYLFPDGSVQMVMENQLVPQGAKKLVVEGGVSTTPVPIAGNGGHSWLSKTFGGKANIAGTGTDAILTGIQWAAIAYMAGQLLGDFLGMSKANTQALSTSLAAGVGVYNFLNTYNFAEGSIFAKGGALGNAGLVGLGIGVIVFVAMYKKVEMKVVEFNCQPWQAPSGGNECEVCNDVDLPCSEYRCKALGQNCEIVNSGTADEKCVNVNPRDVDPPIIKPNYEVLSTGHEYKNVKNSPPGPGFEIVNSEADDGCLKAFTPLTFGITTGNAETGEPSQCRIDFNHTEKFDDMIAFVGGSNLYSYEHEETFSLPNSAALKDSGLIIENGKDLIFYLRCRDKNGNENGAEYAVKFCVDPTPDTTAPKVEATSVLNEGCVAENVDSASVVFYTNEPAECRWSSVDQDYDLMDNEMSCQGELYQANAAQLFGCSTELTGIARDGSKYFVRCKDQPSVVGGSEVDRNEMAQSFEFSLRGSTGLKLKNLRPNGTIFGGVSPAPVELYAETLFGCNNGRAVCKYAEARSVGSGGVGVSDKDYIQFFDTNTEDGIHTQRLDLTAGVHTYYVRCVDAGGNLVEDSVSFDLDIDTNAPVVARIYEEDEMLKIVTVRDSECAYTLNNCDFSFAEGTVMPYANSTVHVAEWDDKKTYYIKCRDEFRNEDADCSVVVRPTRNFL